MILSTVSIRDSSEAIAIKLRTGDELVAIRLSRMARSVRHLTGIAAFLAERGIDLVVLMQGRVVPGGLADMGHLTVRSTEAP